MNNKYICITNWQNYYKMIETNIWGVKKSSISQLKKLHIGDYLLFYIKYGKWKNEKLDSSIYGIYKVDSDIFYDESEIFLYNNEKYPYRVKIKKIFQMDNPKSFRPLIPILQMTKKSLKWGSIFMGKSIIRLETSDFDIIKKYLMN